MVEYSCYVCGKIVHKRYKGVYCSEECHSVGKKVNMMVFCERHALTPNPVQKFTKDEYKQYRLRMMKEAKDKSNTIDWKKQYRIIRKQHTKGLRQKLLTLIGDKCIFCGSQKKIDFHEKNGKEHVNSLRYYLDHPKDFVPLCRYCHLALHYIAIFMKNEIDEIIFFELLDALLKNGQNNRKFYE